MKSACAAAAMLALALAGWSARAEDAPKPDGQQPPAEQAAPSEPKCGVTSNTAFKQKGKTPTFEIELVNSCDVRLRCTVDAFVIGAKGQAQGHGTLILAAAPKGQTTHGTYAMKVKSAGGMANVSHSCKEI